MSEFELVYHWANNLFRGYEPIRQATNTELLVAILDLAKEGMELKDRVKTIEAENADLRNQLRDAKERC